MNSDCVECKEKDLKIKELKQKIKELEEQIEAFGPELSQVKKLDETSQRLLKENIQKVIGDLIGSDPKQKINQMKPFQRTQTSNLTEILKQPIIDEQHTYLGQRFFEHFLIIGPDIEALQQLDQHTNEIKVKPKILYQFPNVNDSLYDMVPLYIFPNDILTKKLEANAHNFNEKVLPELKQIIMQTLQLTKGDNEYSITIPREDIQNNSRMTVSEFVQESNPNVFRNIICFEINEFICIDPNTFSCWLCPIVHCFVSYYPFIKFFLKENANIWNQVKLERIEPCLSETSSHEVLKRDLLFVKSKLNTIIINRLFSLRSIQVTYDQKYQLNEIQIQTPKRDNAQFLQFLWGCDQTFHILSFKELIYLISHVLLSQRVLLFSKRKSVLSHVMITILSLIHPFNYKLPFIICIPDELIDRVAAPCPFFFGVVGEYDNYSQRIEEVQQEDITILDLNTKRIYFSKTQSRDLKKCIAPIKNNSHLKQLYHLINNSRDNAFKTIGKQNSNRFEKSTNSNSVFKDNEKQYQNLLKDIAKSFSTFWHSTVIQHIPIDRRFIKPGAVAILNLPLLQEVMLSKCPKDSKRFIKELIQNPTFTGYLDELYEVIYQQKQ
ncbi:unnamed protein product [Paramecium sonneborni]|uniref:UDENN domain-containing protein n=1 Tax=Paramecium sonneborni TaxID=65129 RepID=A0A8S1QU26_9CILI|nr:unnamed protein product [Paramecium sonneborni]